MMGNQMSAIDSSMGTSGMGDGITGFLEEVMYTHNF
jgi:hypothetical protein